MTDRDKNARSTATPQASPRKGRATERSTLAKAFKKQFMAASRLGALPDSRSTVQALLDGKLPPTCVTIPAVTGHGALWHAERRWLGPEFLCTTSPAVVADALFAQLQGVSLPSGFDGIRTSKTKSGSIRAPDHRAPAAFRDVCRAWFASWSAINTWEDVGQTRPSGPQLGCAVVDACAEIAQWERHANRPHIDWIRARMLEGAALADRDLDQKIAMASGLPSLDRAEMLLKRTAAAHENDAIQRVLMDLRAAVDLLADDASWDASARLIEVYLLISDAHVALADQEQAMESLELAKLVWDRLRAEVDSVPGDPRSVRPDVLMDVVKLRSTLAYLGEAMTLAPGGHARGALGQGEGLFPLVPERPHISLSEFKNSPDVRSRWYRVVLDIGQQGRQRVNLLAMYFLNVLHSRLYVAPATGRQTSGTQFYGSGRPGAGSVLTVLRRLGEERPKGGLLAACCELASQFVSELVKLEMFNGHAQTLCDDAPDHLPVEFKPYDFTGSCLLVLTLGRVEVDARDAIDASSRAEQVRCDLLAAHLLAIMVLDILVDPILASNPTLGFRALAYPYLSTKMKNAAKMSGQRHGRGAGREMLKRGIESLIDVDPDVDPQPERNLRERVRRRLSAHKHLPQLGQADTPYVIHRYFRSSVGIASDGRHVR